MGTRLTWELTRSAASSWIDDYAPSMGAAIAYYTLFSIAPLLLIVISLAGIVFGAEAARGEILDQLRGLMGNEGARAVQALLQAAHRPGQGIIATAAGTVFLAIGATTVFAELQNALDRIWRAPVPRREGITRLLRARLTSFGMIVGIGFLLMVSLIASAALSALGKWWGPMFGDWALVGHVLDASLGFAMTTLGFALIYKVMPRVHIRWRDVWIGAAATAVLFTIGKMLIGLYIGQSSVASVFGAAGSLAVMLLWVYYSAQIFLLGAEFTWVYAYRCGSMRGRVQRPAGQVPSREAASQGAR